MDERSRANEVSASEMASYCRVSQATVRRWVREGILAASSLDGGSCRVDRGTAARFLLDHNYEAPYEALGSWQGRVLIVGRECEALRRCRRALDGKRDSFLVAVCEDATTARMKGTIFHPDIVLAMPSLIGQVSRDLIAADRRDAETPIVAIGAPGEDDARRCVAALADDASADDIVRAVGRWLERGRTQ